MKLRNKKTGEIDDFIFEVIADRIELHRRVGFSGSQNTWCYNSLAELTAEWEDYKEPEEYRYIRYDGEICCSSIHDETTSKMKIIGNYFETYEEAEKAVEKIKAWKRLKDKGFRFERWLIGGEYGNTITFSDYIEYNDETRTDLDLLFGDEE